MDWSGARPSRLVHPGGRSWRLQPRSTGAPTPVYRMNRRLLLTLASIALGGPLPVAPALLADRIPFGRSARSRARPPRLAHAEGTLPAIPVRSQDEIGELTGAFNDMADALSKARDELVTAARLASVGEVAAAIAHEVRTPLGILRGSAQMLGRTG